MEHDEEEKRFMHHYNMPPFATGEARPTRAPNRREIGHGRLAERALEAVIPSEEEFPYTIRVVSEVLSSNGSTSMASVCASTLSLMDAGVPIKAPVSGIAMGLVSEYDENGNFNYKILTDIQGVEDFTGDMDFKVAGTKQGITALQMDMKIKGLKLEVIREAIEQANKARNEILDFMLQVIPAPRDQVSVYAPQMIKIKLTPSQIRDVIGPGGATIQEIIKQTGVKIDFKDDGTTIITARDQKSGEEALKLIKQVSWQPQE
jgi:polyribonucleotide nucleotidyltransferase